MSQRKRLMLDKPGYLTMKQFFSNKSKTPVSY